MITPLQKGKSYFYQISLAMLVAMISIVGCKKNEPVGPTPVIIDFKTISGWAGDVVRIQGSDFDAIAANNIVKFGDKVAVVNTVSNDFLTYNSNGNVSGGSIGGTKPVALLVTVPAGATTGKISVTVNGVTGTSTTDFVVNTETVYITGHAFKNGKESDGYWKNKNFVSVTDGTRDAFTSAIAVVGNDVYVAGTEGDPMTSGRKAKYWKNGVATTLSVQNAEVTSMSIVGNDVYVAGSEIGSTLNFVAKYWKNGIAVNLTDGTKNARATAIQVAGNDIHVLGNDDNKAKYWKNGVVVNLSSNVNSRFYCIFILGNDVYVGGEELGIAKYWKNGVAITLGDGIKEGEITAMQVVGNDIYAIGIEYNPIRGTPYVAKYWKNGIGINLTAGIYGRLEPRSMQILGGDVHIVCRENLTRNVIYLKNGVTVDYGEALGSDGSAIVVIP